MAGIAITLWELTATDLRAAAGKTKAGRAARRMLAIALVPEGVDRTTAAQTRGMDRQTLRGEADQESFRGTVSPTNGGSGNCPGDSFPCERVHRTNAEGVAGLMNRTVPQRPRRLAPEQLAKLAAFGRGRSQPGSGRRGALAAP